MQQTDFCTGYISSFKSKPMKNLLFDNLEIFLKAITISTLMAVAKLCFTKDMNFQQTIKLIFGGGLLGAFVAYLAYDIKVIQPYYKIIAGLIGFLGDKAHDLIVTDLAKVLTQLIKTIPAILREFILRNTDNSNNQQNK